MTGRVEDQFNWLEPDYTPIIKARAARLQRLREDPELLDRARAYYRKHPADFISDWMWTYDPRRINRGLPPNMPFLLFRKQREYLEWLHWDLVMKSRSGLAEKSRDMGVTWLNMGYGIWAWTFIPGIKIGYGSRKEALVDRIGDPDSIFEKGRMLVDTLPPEFVPNGYQRKKHATHMKILNPENGASLTGESGDDIGRGGRNALYFKDESAHYPRPDSIEAALSQNADVKVDVSTPKGSGNPFYKKRHSGKIPVFTFHWMEDPRKNYKDPETGLYPWYEKQKDEIDNPVILAQEVDIDYEASAEDLVIPPAWVRAAVELEIDDSGTRISGLDVADDEGYDVNALTLRKGPVVKEIRTWNGIDTTKTARRAHALAMEFGAHTIVYDAVGVGAGVKGEANSLNLRGVTFVPFKAGASRDISGWYSPPTDEGRGIKNADLFLNWRALGWWNLRRRFENAYKYANGDRSIPNDELISIPNDRELISELSRPMWEETGAGKIKIESKKHMRTVRGVASPNKADALMQSFTYKRRRAGAL